MLNQVAVTAGLISLLGWSTAFAGGGQYSNCCVCPCPCGGSLAAATAAPDPAPPAAPQQGDTAQSQSIEPQAAPPAAPVAGVTTRSYSVQPAPVYRYVPQRARRYDERSPIYRQHPSNRLQGPGGRY